MRLAHARLLVIEPLCSSQRTGGLACNALQNDACMRGMSLTAGEMYVGPPSSHNVRANPIKAHTLKKCIYKQSTSEVLSISLSQNYICKSAELLAFYVMSRRSRSHAEKPCQALGTPWNTPIVGPNPLIPPTDYYSKSLIYNNSTIVFSVIRKAGRNDKYWTRVKMKGYVKRRANQV